MKGKEREKIGVAFVNQPWNNAVPPVRSGSIAIWTYEVARRLADYHDVIVYGKKSFKDRYKLDNGVLYRYFRTGLDTWSKKSGFCVGVFLPPLALEGIFIYVSGNFTNMVNLLVGILFTALPAVFFKDFSDHKLSPR